MDEQGRFDDTDTFLPDFHLTNTPKMREAIIQSRREAEEQQTETAAPLKPLSD